MGPPSDQSDRALLALEDGTLFWGRCVGCPGETFGELVFNTGMTGYQEVLTDPSYRGQIVTMTAPQIGNTGINPEDSESSRLWLAGFIVREASPIVSNWRATKTLDSWLREHGIVGITGTSTRALVRHIRLEGAMRGVLSSVESDVSMLLGRARSIPPMTGLDLVPEVTCDSPYTWTEGVDRSWYVGDEGDAPRSDQRYHVVAYDFGIKWNILRLMSDRGFRVTVVPATTSAAEALSLMPDGVFLSNGPGDPAAVTYAVDTIRALLGKVPVFGICLGHQLLGLALGGQTYKLKFGHRGINQPVKNLLTGRVEISTHNHGFAVDGDSLPPEVEITHVNLNDRCVEGLRHRELPVFGVQYHPEAGAGPHDSTYLFDSFRRLMDRAHEKAAKHA